MDNAMKKDDGQKKPNGKMIGVILAVIIVIVLVILALTSKKGEEINIPAGENGPVAGQNETGEPMAPGEEREQINTIVTETGQVIPEGSVVEVPGANPIIENVVVTPTGQVADNAAIPMSPDAPQQTPPISKEELPSSVIKLDLAATGFSPNSFEVKKGAPVTFSISSIDDITHVFMFDSPELSAVAIGVSPGETRAITFNAPATAGEYTFRCDVPGHAGRGEVGKMIVK